MFECIFCLGRSFSTEKLLKQHCKGKKHTENAAAVTLDAAVAKTLAQREAAAASLAQRDRLLSQAAAASAAANDLKRAADAASLAQRDRLSSEAAAALAVDIQVSADFADRVSFLLQAIFFILSSLASAHNTSLVGL